MTRSQYISLAKAAGCPRDQVENFLRAGIYLEPKQILASLAARSCDLPDGPTALGYGGARGGGKSFWIFAQAGADDCQRFPGLKCLVLRKVGKANAENFNDFRLKLFRRLPHSFSRSRGLLSFPNGSSIVTGHFQRESDIDSYLGIEYDLVIIEEATTLTYRKYLDITSCCRTSKPGWRPRIYTNTNPGGVGHVWYYKTFIVPFQNHAETITRFIPALVTDNPNVNAGYLSQLNCYTGWRRAAWLEGLWNIAAGQFFSTFRHDIHVLSKFDENRGVEWFAAMDYGFTHYTVVLLACRDSDGNIYVVDEHAERNWLPRSHAAAIKAMFRRHRVDPEADPRNPNAGRGLIAPLGSLRNVTPEQIAALRRPHALSRFVSGLDVLAKQADGISIARQYDALGLPIRPTVTDRIAGWAKVLELMGDPEHNIPPRLFFHERCGRLIETLPALQHDPNRPEDILKTDPDEDGSGGDDSADALRYLVATKPNEIRQEKLHGL